MKRTNVLAKRAATRVFWREEALPFIEGRSIEDGRKVCYEKHTHDRFSIGAIFSGQSIYFNGGVKQHSIQAGPRVRPACDETANGRNNL